MKKSLLLIFLAAIVLTGCASTTTSKPTMTADQLFQKKQECASLRDKMDEQINKNPDYSGCFNITQIFYSSVRNSCMYIMQNIGYQDNENCRWGLTGGSTEKIFDYFTNEMIIGNKPLERDYNGKSRMYCSSKFIGYVKNGKYVKIDDYTGNNECMLEQYYTRVQELKGE